MPASGHRADAQRASAALGGGIAGAQAESSASSIQMQAHH